MGTVGLISRRLLHRQALIPLGALALAVAGVTLVLGPSAIERDDAAGGAGLSGSTIAAKRLAMGLGADSPDRPGASSAAKRAAEKGPRRRSSATTEGPREELGRPASSGPRGASGGSAARRAAKASARRKKAANKSSKGSSKGARGRARQAKKKSQRRASKRDTPPPDGNERLVADDSEANAEAQEELEDLGLGAAVDTPVVGKIMSHDNREGVEGVTVHLLVYHPLSAVAGAPAWIVPITTVTDDKGLFSATLPLPEVRPTGMPSVGLIASRSEQTPLFGVPLFGLAAGFSESIGVFWLPGPVTRELKGVIAPSSLSEGAQLHDTGGLNPLAWDDRVRSQVLALFPSQGVPSDVFQLSIPREDAVHGAERWLSLSQSGVFTGARPVTWVEAAENSSSEEPPRIAEVEFRFGAADNSLSGSVVALGGAGIAGAVVTTSTLIPQPAQTVLTDAAGFFRILKAPASLTSLTVSHPDFLTQAYAVNASALAPTLVLETPRPDIPLVLRDSVTSEPIRSARFTLFGPTSAGSTPEQLIIELQSETGDYRLGASFAVARLELSAEGYFSDTIDQPDNRPQTPIEARLVPARVVPFTARDCVARSGHWRDLDDHSLFAYSGMGWLEWDIDHGAQLAAFEFEIGVHNHGIIDHSYRFRIRVDLDGVEVGELSILASQSKTISERISLPPGDGVHQLRITWLNDRYIPHQLDANIAVDWVKFHQRPLTPTEQSVGAPSSGG
jgi:hypothetical protein